MGALKAWLSEGLWVDIFGAISDFSIVRSPHSAQVSIPAIANFS
jgi:hypothetical protein